MFRATDTPNGRCGLPHLMPVGPLRRAVGVEEEAAFVGCW